jgi:type IV secretory pathway VirB2 component (pilin)
MKNKQKVNNYLIFLLTLVSTNSYAAGGGLSAATNLITKIISFFTSGFTVAAATLVLIIMGFAFWFGRLSVQWVVGFLVGSVLIFGSAQIASWALS